MKARSTRGAQPGIVPFLRHGAVEAVERAAPKEDLAFQLGSWLCHELAGPLGVLVGSLDLLDVADAEVQAEARAMLAEAVDDMMERLAFNRIAFGRAGRVPEPHGPPEQTESGEEGGDEGLGDGRLAKNVGPASFAGMGEPESDIPRQGPLENGDGFENAPFVRGQSAAGVLPEPGDAQLQTGNPEGKFLPAEEILRILRRRFEPRLQIVWSAPRKLPRHDARRLFLSILAVASRMPKGGRIEIVLETRDEGPVWRFETGAAALSTRGNATSALCEALLNGQE